jgi:hypothetical protein
MSLEEIRARTAARRAAGENQHYPRPAKPTPKPVGACPYFGAPTGETAACQTCAGKVELTVFACALPKHGKCTVARKVDGVACCAGCPDRPAHSGTQTQT